MPRMRYTEEHRRAGELFDCSRGAASRFINQSLAELAPETVEIPDDWRTPRHDRDLARLAELLTLDTVNDPAAVIEAELNRRE